MPFFTLPVLRLLLKSPLSIIQKGLLKSLPFWFSECTKWEIKAKYDKKSALVKNADVETKHFIPEKVFTAQAEGKRGARNIYACFSMTSALCSDYQSQFTMLVLELSRTEYEQKPSSALYSSWFWLVSFTQKLRGFPGQYLWKEVGWYANFYLLLDLE